MVTYQPISYLHKNPYHGYITAHCMVIILPERFNILPGYTILSFLFDSSVQQSPDDRHCLTLGTSYGLLISRTLPISLQRAVTNHFLVLQIRKSSTQEFKPKHYLTLKSLTSTIVAPSSNASKS